MEICTDTILITTVPTARRETITVILQNKTLPFLCFITLMLQNITKIALHPPLLKITGRFLPRDVTPLEFPSFSKGFNTRVPPVGGDEITTPKITRVIKRVNKTRAVFTKFRTVQPGTKKILSFPLNPLTTRNKMTPVLVTVGRRTIRTRTITPVLLILIRTVDQDTPTPQVPYQIITKFTEDPLTQIRVLLRVAIQLNETSTRTFNTRATELFPETTVPRSRYQSAVTTATQIP